MTMGWLYLFSVVEHLHYGAWISGGLALATLLISTLSDDSNHYEKLRARALAIVVLSSFVATVTPTLDDMLRQRVIMVSLEKYGTPSVPRDQK